VKVPVIQLTSNPPVPDSEKLSWLVLGQGTTTGGGDLAALQAASAALLGAHGKPISASIAQSIGLDTITFKSAERSTQPGTPAPRTRSSPSASESPIACRSCTSRGSPSRPIPCASNTS
jgi:translocation and assembly module TamB